MFGIDAGILFGTKSQIMLPRGGRTIDKSDGLGYYIAVTVPLHSDSFEFGINSLGYNDRDNNKKAAQIFFGWTFYL